MRTLCKYETKADDGRRAFASRGALRGMLKGLLVGLVLLSMSASARADQLRMADGSAIEVDEAWEDSQGVWYRRGGVTHLVERSRVRRIERATTTAAAVSAKSGAEKAAASEVAAVNSVDEEIGSQPPAQDVWIYLVGGAKMEVDEANETPDGVWYKRGNLSIFIERARVDHIERERIQPEEAADPVTGKRKRREPKWTTGSLRLDALVRQNGARFGVDPFLIFCVMEQESHFNARALSPVGASGLMQLMPGTAARFGVRNSRDPAQNVMGGTRYLKELLRRFNNRVDLVLAGYNAGEGAVMKYGHRVPPYRETRNYVRRISARYGRGE
ncbi:MAG TPA: lytic transglycosylase domain-containing protein [Pyrinomonadaceae bacterium]|jgi:Zn-finger nucleic acid-binding protein|nr:lytic transglycosylase domain-containing protein [Pyrinomonadaceae bacterium]